MNYRLLKWMARNGVRRSNLRGTIVHRVLGNRIFSRELWVFTKHSVRNGWIIGSFAAANPFLGLQIFVSIPFVVALRANLFVTIGLIFTTNPFTIGPFLAFAYWVGSILTGGASTADGEKIAAEFERLGALGFLKTAWNDWHLISGLAIATMLGCLLIGSVSAAVGAGLIHALWKEKPRQGNATPAPAGNTAAKTPAEPPAVT
jgi:uncharacterized protein (DUF2062 family)